MKLKPAILALSAATLGFAQGQTSYTSTTETGLLNTSRWNNSTDAAPYGSAFIANNALSFTSGTYSFSGANSSGVVNVGNVTLADNVTVNFTGNSGTFGTGGVVRTLSVGSGATLDFNSQGFSTAAGTGFIKSGAGVLALVGGAYNGGFTLDSGAVIARGVDAFGASATNVLTLNGGTVASNASRSFSDSKHGGGIVIGGNVQFGELATVVSQASSSANLSFANNASLGGATRTLTIGNNGSNTFTGIISGDQGVGLTIAAASGVTGNFTLGGINSYSGATTIKGGKLVLSPVGTIESSTSIIVGDGGSSGAILDTTAKEGFTILESQTLKGIGTVNVGAVKTLTIEGTHAVGNVGTNGGVGGQSVTGNLSYSSSIFDWDLNPPVSAPEPEVVLNRGSYDQVTASGTITGASSVFNVVLGAGKLYTDAFWNSDKSWNNVFTASNAPNLASIFTSFGGSSVAVDGIVSGQGQFGFSGSTLTWSAVPEPTSALAGLLITAGLLRRRRRVA